MTKKTDYIIEEAARLTAIYKHRKKLDPSLNQSRIADACDWSSQSVVSQYMTGKIPLNLTALLKLSRSLKFKPSDVSERLVKLYPFEYSAPTSEPFKLNEPKSVPLYCNTLAIHPLEVFEDCSPLAPDEVELAYCYEIERVDGKGTEVKSGINGHRVRFSKQILNFKGINSDNARCLIVEGNSMEPVLRHGSMALIDTSPAPIEEGKMYALDYHGQLIVRLLFKLPKHGIRLHCFNIRNYPDERVAAEDLNHNVRILGKVFWYATLV